MMPEEKLTEANVTANVIQWNLERVRVLIRECRSISESADNESWVKDFMEDALLINCLMESAEKYLDDAMEENEKNVKRCLNV